MLTINKTENMGKIRFFILSFFMLLIGVVLPAQSQTQKSVKKPQKIENVPKKKAVQVVAKAPVRPVVKPLPVKTIPKRNLLTQKIKISRQQINFYAKKKIIAAKTPLTKVIPVKVVSRKRFAIKHVTVTHPTKHKVAAIKLARSTKTKKSRFAIKKSVKKEEVLLAKKEKKENKASRFEIEKKVEPAVVDFILEPKVTETKPVDKPTAVATEQKPDGVSTESETTELKPKLAPDEARNQYEIGRRMFAKLDSTQTASDASQALKTMEAAANSGNQDALWYLGSAYMSGTKYILKDTKAAKYWFQKYKESVGAKP